MNKWWTSAFLFCFLPSVCLHPILNRNRKAKIFIGAFEKDELVGCCVLTKKTNESIQLRQMAVKKSVQGKGAGRAIIRFAEDEARNLNYRQLILNARDPVIGFYTKCGYEIRSEQFFEAGLAHHEMSKQL
jgi:predicted GNAT family N-acyltransferase